MSSAAPIGRRTAIKLMSAGASGLGLLAASSIPAVAASPELDLTNQKERLRAFIMMRGALDDRLVIGYLSGRYYGVVDSEMTPLYGVSAATFSRYRALPDGGYEMVSFEQAYFTDLDTGSVMETWLNPYTNQTVKVPVTRTNPSKTIINADLSFKHTPTPGFHAEHIVLPAENLEDEILFVEQTRVSVDRPAPAKPFRYNEIVSLRASATALKDRNAKRVPCTTGFNAIVAWRPWQEMGDRPGHLLAQGSGRYGAVIENLPKAWLEATQRLRPELLTNPGQVIDAIWRS